MVADMPAVSEWAPIDLDDLTTSFAAFVLMMLALGPIGLVVAGVLRLRTEEQEGRLAGALLAGSSRTRIALLWLRSEEHTSELQSRGHLVCRLLLEKKKNKHSI